MGTLVHFHQGWTDIINCLGLIGYYDKHLPEKFHVLVRKDAIGIVAWFCRDKPKVAGIVYTDLGRLGEAMLDRQWTRRIFHGDHDTGSTVPALRGAYWREGIRHEDFVSRFYLAYGIPASVRVDEFRFLRDSDLELSFAKKILEENNVQADGGDGADGYIVVHAGGADINAIPWRVHTNAARATAVNLAGCSNTFFDAIKLLQDAREIHVLDSVWGAFVFCLDAKYSLFREMPVHVYCLREYQCMFEKPYGRLPNWTIHYAADSYADLARLAAAVPATGASAPMGAPLGDTAPGPA